MDDNEIAEYLKRWDTDRPDLYEVCKICKKAYGNHFDYECPVDYEEKRIKKRGL